MLFEISYIDKQGEIESLRRTVCGEEFESMIHVMKYRSKKTFIYDATLRESIFNDQYDTLTPDCAFQRNLNIDVQNSNENQTMNNAAIDPFHYFSI